MVSLSTATVTRSTTDPSVFMLSVNDNADADTIEPEDIEVFLLSAEDLQDLVVQIYTALDS